MSFLFLIAYLWLSFLRPGEFYPELAPLRIMNVATIICGVATLAATALGHRPNLKLPQPYLVVAFFLWCAFSVVAALRWPGGYLEPLNELAPGVTVFLLLYFNVDSRPRLHLTCLALSALSVVLSAQVLYSYHTNWRAETFMLRVHEDEQIQEMTGAESGWADADSATPGGLVRMRSLGFLHDPNDLAQALVSMLPFTFLLRRPGRSMRNLAMVWLPAATVLYAVVLTRSRGAIVALGALCFLALRPVLGRTASLAMSVLGGLAAVGLGFTGGRAMGVDESAEGRIEAWEAGFEMLKSSPIWGVGQGMFIENHSLVAHNSFVQCFAETGLVGYFLWLSIIVVTFLGLLRIERAEPEKAEGGDMRPLAHAARLGLASFLVAALFLSRTYNVMLFLHLGMGAVACGLVARSQADNPVPPARVWAPATAMLTAGSVVGFWLLMKVM